LAPAFIPGLDLSRTFHKQCVAPIMARHHPRVSYTAGLLHTGSEVLGFDTARSMDHWWGPRVELFLRDEGASRELRDEIRGSLANELPFEFRGAPTPYARRRRGDGSVFVAQTDQRPINHLVVVRSVRRFLANYLGSQPLDEPLSPAQWLSMPEQHLRTIASGGVWRDDIGELTRTRRFK
jgi:hypothetical protein